MLFAALSCATLCARAQSYHIKGTVKDREGKPLGGTTVTLLSSADSSWIKSELTEDNGAYNLTDVAKGSYIVDFNLVGYNNEKRATTIQDKDETLNIDLSKKSTELKEIVVTADKPFIEREAGKTTVNVNADKAAGSNVLDLLRKMPGITVSGNGTISMTGKQGVLVTVNGKQTYLSGEELTNYLRSMQAEQVAQVEIISQPGAKYDAEGSAGVLNIKTRKNKKEGLSGTASASYGKTRFSGTSDNLRLNYKQNKTAVMVNAGYYNHAGFLEQEIDRSFKDPETYALTAVQRQTSYWKERFKDYSLSADIEQEINDNTTLSAQVKGVYHPNSEQDQSHTVINDVANNTTTVNDYYNQRDFVRTNYNANLQLNKKWTDKHELIASAEYVDYNVDNRQDMTNRNYDGNGNFIPGGLILKGDLPTTTDVAGAKADYSGTFGKTKIEAGVKTSFVAIEAGVNFNVNDNGVWRYDSVRNNNFIYKENINAAYVSCAHTFSEKLDAKAGLRAEHTLADGLQEVGNVGFNRNYLSLFPTAYLNYKPNDKYNFGLNYGRRVQRPEYRQLNPYIEFTSQYSYRSGNPRLMPTFSHHCELTGSYKNTLFVTATYRNISDIINNVARQNNNTYVYYVMPENIAKASEVQFALTFNKALYKWWEVSASAWGFELYYDGFYNGLPLRDKGTGFGFYTSGDLNFAHNWKAGYWFTGQGRSRESSMVTADSNLMYGFSVSKRLFKDTTTVRLNVTDPFGTYTYGWGIDLQDVYMHANNRYNTRDFTVSVTYDFGKQIERMRNNDASSDASGRQRM